MQSQMLMGQDGPRAARRGGRPRIRTILTYFVLSLFFFAIGSFLVWGQHSGVPARMTVEQCGYGKSRHGFNPVNLIMPDCRGRLSDAPNRPLMKIDNGWWGDKGHDINVHIVGSGRYPIVIKDSWFQPAIWLGFGFLAGLGAVSGIVGRLRSTPT